jgi:prolyl-tRNA editing enzyme YbaK/EbsC (Cys-tRNA(Pro) deacylase)
VPDTPVHPSLQRVLDAAARKGVTLEVVTFDESTHTAVEAAAALGVELAQIVKSLVFVVPGEAGPEPLLCLVAGHNRVDLARLAAVTGATDLRRASAREAHDMTGFAIGGIPPIGHLRPPRVIMDPDLGLYPIVWAAAGLSTAVFGVPPATLRILSNATVAPMTEDRSTAERDVDVPLATGA